MFDQVLHSTPIAGSTHNNNNNSNNSSSSSLADKKSIKLLKKRNAELVAIAKKLEEKGLKTEKELEEIVSINDNFLDPPTLEVGPIDRCQAGIPTSVFLFIIYVDVLIKMIKTRSPVDGFLSWLHLLMLMDDTIIFATSRKKLEEKLGVLCEYCNEYGMQVNEGKTELMVPFQQFQV